MIKAYWVVCELNMDASYEVKMVVKANSQRKAEDIAISSLYKEGYFHVKLISCKEMT